MTRDQQVIAAGVRDELLLMFQDAGLLVERALALEGVCQHYGLPALDGALRPKLAQAVLGAEAAHAAYEEFCGAKFQENTSKATGGMTATSLEGLKRASTPGQPGSDPAGARSGAGAVHSLAGAPP